MIQIKPIEGELIVSEPQYEENGEKKIENGNVVYKDIRVNAVLLAFDKLRTTEKDGRSFEEPIIIFGKEEETCFKGSWIRFGDDLEIPKKTFNTYVKSFFAK